MGQDRHLTDVGAEQSGNRGEAAGWTQLGWSPERSFGLM